MEREYIFPDNHPGRFVNHLAAPIMLDPNYEYEIGLVSILYPNEYYAIVGNQYKNTLTFYNKMKVSPDIEKFSYTLQNNIPAGDIENLIYCINNELKLRLIAYYDKNYGKFFKRGSILYCDKYKKRVGMYYNAISRSRVLKKGDIEEVMIYLGERIAEIFGFCSNMAYPLYSEDYQKSNTISGTSIN